MALSLLEDLDREVTLAVLGGSGLARHNEALAAFVPQLTCMGVPVYTTLAERLTTLVTADEAAAPDALLQVLTLLRAIRTTQLTTDPPASAEPFPEPVYASTPWEEAPRSMNTLRRVLDGSFEGTGPEFVAAAAQVGEDVPALLQDRYWREWYEGVTKKQFTITQKAVRNYHGNGRMVLVPPGVNAIEYFAFNRCAVEVVVVPPGVIRIGASAFSKCPNLTLVVLPPSITKIGSSAFSDCSRLRSITLPDGINIIESYTFDACSSLTSILIPAHVTFIDAYAFRKCTSLENIVLQHPTSDNLEIANTAFKGCPGKPVLREDRFAPAVPSGLTF